MVVAFKRVSALAFLGLLPVLILAIGAKDAIEPGFMGVDFRGELYPEAQYVLAGHNPFPPADAVLGAANRVFPVPAALLVSPLTALQVETATYVWCLLSLVGLVAALRLLGVRDWRIYGLVMLWPPTISELQAGNLTIVLALLVAIAWKFRERRFAPGVAIGLAIAIKLFLWPLGIWLLARRQFASTIAAAGLAVAGVLAVLPFESPPSYMHLMNKMAKAYGPPSYNPVGLLSQAGATNWHLIEVVVWSIGLAVLALAVRRRSLSLAVAASLLLSPIVWLHYFLLLIVPLALRWQRLSAAWFIPLFFWFCRGSNARLSDIIIGLSIFAVVIVASEADLGAFRIFSAIRPAGVTTR